MWKLAGVVIGLLLTSIHEQYLQHQNVLGKEISVSGLLFSAHTNHDHAPLLMDQVSVGHFSKHEKNMSLLVSDPLRISLRSYSYDRGKGGKDENRDIEYDLLYATADCSEDNEGECAVVSFGCEKRGVSITIFGVDDVHKRRFLDALGRKDWHKLIVEVEINRIKYSYQPWSFEISYSEISSSTEITVKIFDMKDSDFTETASKPGLSLALAAENLKVSLPLGGEHTAKWQRFHNNCAGIRR